MTQANQGAEKPAREGFEAPFWNNVDNGIFVLPKCAECGLHHWAPRPFCPHCRSRSITWAPASGEGTIYSFSVVTPGPKQYVLAYIQLAENITILSNIVDSPVEGLRIGAAVRATIGKPPSGEGSPYAERIPLFRLT